MARRKTILQSTLIAAAIFAATVAVAPIICAALGIFGAGAAHDTAFAAAAPGQYAVVARTEGSVDIVAVASPQSDAAPIEVARIPHLDGFGVRGAVSPDGQRIAIVAATSGPAPNPNGSLLVVDLTSGKQTTLLANIDPQQTPAWDRTGDAIAVARDQGDGPITVQFLLVSAHDGSQSPLDTVEDVLGAYAVGFDPSGRFVDVAIGADGSVVRRAGVPLQSISTQVTRDWQLSPDGAQLAFIESSLVGGLHYIGRVVALDGVSATSDAQIAGDAQQLGVAWQPGAAQPTFGDDPSTPLATASGELQVAAGSGFDIPLAYSHDGKALAVEHWSGASFADAGQSTLQLVEDGNPTSLTNFSRFLGWTAR